MDLLPIVALGAVALLAMRRKKPAASAVEHTAHGGFAEDVTTPADVGVARPAPQVMPLAVSVFRDDPGAGTFAVLIPETGVAYEIAYGALGGIRGPGLGALQSAIERWSSTLYPTEAANLIAAVGRPFSIVAQNGPTSPEVDRLFQLSQEIARGTVDLRAQGYTLGDMLNALAHADTTVLLQRLEGELQQTFAALRAYDASPYKTAAKNSDAKRLLALVRHVQESALPAITEAAQRGQPLADPQFVHGVLYTYVQFAPVLRTRIGG